MLVSVWSVRNSFMNIWRKIKAILLLKCILRISSTIKHKCCTCQLYNSLVQHVYVFYKASNHIMLCYCNIILLLHFAIMEIWSNMLASILRNGIGKKLPYRGLREKKVLLYLYALRSFSLSPLDTCTCICFRRHEIMFASLWYAYL